MGSSRVIKKPKTKGKHPLGDVNLSGRFSTRSAHQLRISWLRAPFPACPPWLPPSAVGLRGAGVRAGKMWGTDKVGAEAGLRLTLVCKGPIWMKRSRVNGVRAGQSSGVADCALSDQDPEQVSHSSKKHLVWWQLLGRQQALILFLSLFSFVVSHSLVWIW